MTTNGMYRVFWMSLQNFRNALVRVLLISVMALPVVASGEDRAACKGNQDCALDAFRSGQIRPLSDVLAAVRATVPGEVIKIELDREDGVWIYELKILTTTGRRREVEINANTLEIIKVK